MKFLKNPVWIFTSLLILVPLIIFGTVYLYQYSFQKLPVLGGYDIVANHLPIQHTVSDFEFENQDSRKFTSASAKNKIIVANFFFTSCAGICPAMMNHIKSVQEYYLQNPDIIFISFTVDPIRDSAARLKWYVQQYHFNTSNWELLTGDKKIIYKIARKSFYLSANDGDGGENDFIHSEQLVLVDKAKHIRGYYNGTDDKSMEQLKHDIKKIENEN